MVVENPLTDEQQDALDKTLEEVISGSVSEVEVSTADGDYDYDVSLRESTNKPKVRGVKLQLVWHEGQSDWEIANRNNGMWMS